VMKVTQPEIPTIKILKRLTAMSAAFFSEVFKESILRDMGLTSISCRISLPVCEERVVRGLHFQIPPFAQAKLLRVNFRFDIRCRGRYTLGFAELRPVCRGGAQRFRMEPDFIPKGLPTAFVRSERTQSHIQVTSYYSRARSGPPLERSSPRYRVGR